MDIANKNYIYRSLLLIYKCQVFSCTVSDMSQQVLYLCFGKNVPFSFKNGVLVLNKSLHVISLIHIDVTRTSQVLR